MNPQLRTILWLRWRLTRNQWAKSGGLGAVIAGLVAGVGLLAGLGGFAGAFAAGAFGLGTVRSDVIMFIWLALTGVFLFFWILGLLNELQRSETIDLQRLMHLPVALGPIFVVNYIASHLALSIVIVVPAMIGLAIGLTVSRGPSMLLLIPLAVSMVLMITAWTYYLRGWLAAMMTNPRKRRAIIMGLSFAVIVMIQVPNLYLNFTRNFDEDSRQKRRNETAEQKKEREAADLERLSAFMKVAAYVPPLWVPLGARGLAEGRVWPGLLGTAGCLGIAALGLRRAYRSTVRFYQGDSGGKASARPARAESPRPVAARKGPMLVERRPPGIPEESAAIATATFQSMLRAPEVKMQWGMPFLVLLIVGGSIAYRAGPKVPVAGKPFVVTGIIIFSMFLMVQLVANQFGFDREGFRALVLSPVQRRLILLGKNLAGAPAPTVLGLGIVTMVSIWIHNSPLVYLAAVFQIISTLAILSIGGNLLSIFVPFRIQPGTMKPTKMPGLAVLMLVLSQFVFPILMLPLFAAPLAGWLWERAGGPPAGLTNLVISALLAASIVFAYWKLLGPLGRLLQRRETKILATVTAEVE
ncbi:MAG TPA: hypothetical protein VFV78_02920 [Vicinamibacterales bacterium]|nr:hypothetical protein [Vicinamibacterales bacterium]